MSSSNGMGRTQAITGPRAHNERLRIVVADDDAVSLRVLQAIIGGRTRHQVVAVSSGEEALAAARSDPYPDVLVLDWMMPGLSGTDVCRAIRAEPFEVQPYILLVTGRRERDDVIDGLSSGADDLLVKPVPPDLLLARLRLAANRPTPGRQATHAIAQALVDARGEGSGELLVRDGDTSARVYFCGGKIAWAQVSEDRSMLLDTLAPDLELDNASIRSVIDECRRTGAGFGETLVRWGLLDRARLRAGMRTWIQRKLAMLREFRRPLTLFLPGERRYAEDLLFDLEELLDPTELASLPPSLFPSGRPASEDPKWDNAFVLASAPNQQVEELLSACMASEGVEGAAVLDRTTGICQGRAGSGLSPEATWAQIGSLNAVSLRARVEDGVVITDQHYHIASPLPGAEETFLYAVVNRKTVMLAGARINIQQLLRRFHVAR